MTATYTDVSDRIWDITAERHSLSGWRFQGSCRAADRTRHVTGTCANDPVEACIETIDLAY